MQGFFSIWAVDKATGERTLLRKKKNMILNQGADLVAQALAGVANTNISHMYIGYKNAPDGTFTKPTIDKEYSIPFSGYGTGVTYSDFGYLRVPLAYSPSFIAQSGYNSNIALFTTIITTSDSGINSSVNFIDEVTAGETLVDPSQIFEVALVAALDPTGESQDKVFSRAQFEPLLYNPSYNLTITWGVQFEA